MESIDGEIILKAKAFDEDALKIIYDEFIIPSLGINRENKCEDKECSKEMTESLVEE